MSAIPHLQKQLQELTLSPPGGIRVEAATDIYEWIIWFRGPVGTPYEGGVYKAFLTFPKEFPMKPPEFRIASSFWHPNVYANGKFCISILHNPGEDDLNTEETAMLRWTPVRTIRSVLISIMSLLYDPDPQDSGAPANVDALVQFRKNRDEYNAKCQQLASKSIAALPPNFVMPSLEEVPEKPKPYDHSGFEMDDDVDDDTDDISVAANPQQQGNYLEELQQLRDMEFAPHMSDEALLALLAQHRGEVANVILELSD
eukprot:gene13322-9158_t